ncbi:hypothetical protein B1R94_12965 [Mycolicibacterium litorale]|nr:hypothetical protein B1R94_12965 [Mycolicibacterium litorale]
MTFVDPVAAPPAVVVVAEVVVLPAVAANTPVVLVENPSKDSSSRRVQSSSAMISWATGGAAGGLMLWTMFSSVDMARPMVVVATATVSATLLAVGDTGGATDSATVAAAGVGVGVSRRTSPTGDAEVDVATWPRDMVRRPASVAGDIGARTDVVPVRVESLSVAERRLDGAGEGWRAGREPRAVAEPSCAGAVAAGDCAESLAAVSACAVPSPAIAVPIPNATAKPPIRPI